MKIIYFIIPLLLSCESNNNFFNGKFIQSKQEYKTINLDLKKINIDLIGVNSLTVIDTFIVAETGDRNDYLLATYSTNDYKLLSRFFNKGNGNNEELFISYENDNINEDGDVKMWFRTFNRLKLIDIKESSKNGNLIIDSVIDTRKFDYYGVSDYNIINDTILSGFKYSTNDIKYVHCNLKNDSVIEKFCMYNTNVLDPKLTFSNFRINKNVKKVASGMMFFNQINIFDIDGNSNSTFSTSIDKSPIQEVFVKNKSFEERITYYRYIQTTDNYILSSYSGNSGFTPCRTIHLFDWYGNLKYMLNSNKDFTYFSIDIENNQIYLYGVNETCYLASLSELGIL